MITSYDTLPIGKYEEICRLSEEYKEEPYQRSMLILSILSDIPVSELEDMPISKFSALMKQTAFILEQPAIKKVQVSYKVGKFILVPTKDLNELTAGQFIDYQTIVSQPSVDKVALLSCILIPKGCKYGKGYDMAEVHEAIREHLPVTALVDLSAFFLTLCYKWLRVTQIYCMLTPSNKIATTEMEKMLTQQIDGNGFGALMLYLRLPVILGAR